MSQHDIKYIYSKDDEGRRTRIPASFNSLTDEGSYPLEIEGRCPKCGSSVWVRGSDPSCTPGRQPSAKCSKCQPTQAELAAQRSRIEKENNWFQWKLKWRFRLIEWFEATCDFLCVPLLVLLVGVALPLIVKAITEPTASANEFAALALGVCFVSLCFYPYVKNFYNTLAGATVASPYQTGYERRRSAKRVAAFVLWLIGMTIFGLTTAVSYFFYS